MSESRKLRNENLEQGQIASDWNIFSYNFTHVSRIFICKCLGAFGCTRTDIGGQARGICIRAYTVYGWPQLVDV